MATFQIVKRNRPDLFLWRLPNGREAWGTEAEMQALTAAPNGWLLMGTTPEARAAAEREFDADFVAQILAKDPEAKPVPVGTPRSRFRDSLPLLLLVFFAGFWLGVVVARR